MQVSAGQEQDLLQNDTACSSQLATRPAPAPVWRKRTQLQRRGAFSDPSLQPFRLCGHMDNWPNHVGSVDRKASPVLRSQEIQVQKPELCRHPATRCYPRRADLTL